MKKTLITFSLALSLFTLHSFACSGSKCDTTKKSSYSSRAAVLNVGDSCAGKTCEKSKASCEAKKGSCPAAKAKTDCCEKSGSCEKEKAKK
jgi:hypothetical protein